MARACGAALKVRPVPTKSFKLSPQAFRRLLFISVYSRVSLELLVLS